MNLDEGWELIPEEGFLEIHDDGGKQIYSRKYSGGSSKCMLQRNYFICPPTDDANQFVETTHAAEDHHTDTNMNTTLGDQLTVPIQAIKSFETVADQDPVSQVFFKKMKDAEFIPEMRLESPRSNRGSMPPQMEGGLQFEAEGDHVMGDQEMEIKKMELGRGDEGGLNIWKCCLTGMGAICSFGMAAATITVIVLSGSHQQNKHKIQFQIYTNDKRNKKPVHHTGVIHEAISAVRGIAAARPARITVGGQYS